jgi:hypothetical protein
MGRDPVDTEPERRGIANKKCQETKWELSRRTLVVDGTEPIA